jgi:hypothetical protein
MLIQYYHKGFILWSHLCGNSGYVIQAVNQYKPYHFYYARNGHLDLFLAQWFWWPTRAVDSKNFFFGRFVHSVRRKWSSKPFDQITAKSDLSWRREHWAPSCNSTRPAAAPALERLTERQVWNQIIVRIVLLFAFFPAIGSSSRVPSTVISECGLTGWRLSYLLQITALKQDAPFCVDTICSPAVSQDLWTSVGRPSGNAMDPRQSLLEIRRCFIYIWNFWLAGLRNLKKM